MVNPGMVVVTYDRRDVSSPDNDMSRSVMGPADVAPRVAASTESVSLIGGKY
jgi:hypothetical protein